MLQKRTELEKKELILLLSWLKGEVFIQNKKFNYDELLQRCMIDDDDDDIPINVSDYFDDLMLDLYSLYEKLSKITKEQIEEKIVNNTMFKILPKKWIEESMRSYQSFLHLYEELMMSSKFEYPQIRKIQKNLMNDFITRYIASEEYEKCIDLKEKIKEV
ncbi:MAG: hypothetical protein HPY57_15420 [Ignavibacteria bacterium]|nr:hypothetical protein [Ignavibacteria bacterium]